MLQTARGMTDYPPEEKIIRQNIVETLKRIFETYGFNPLETPIVERWKTLSAKYAGGEQILKETFRLTDRGGRQLGLRYELTTSMARYIGSNPMIKKPFKVYQIGPVFRDGPIKKGRTRQFIQCDADTVGSDSMLADAELINLTHHFFGEIGFPVIAKVNNRKILRGLIQLADIDPDKSEQAILSLDKLAKIGPDGVLDEFKKTRIDTTKGEKLLQLTSSAGDNQKKIAELSEKIPQNEGVDEIKEVFGHLQEPEKSVFEPSLARGLAYYTGTIFEFYLQVGEFSSSLAAGGRYDELIGNFAPGKEQFPAVGISFGLEPLTVLVKDKNKSEGRETKKSLTQVYVIPIGTREESWKMLESLRSAGIRADIDLMDRGVGSALEFANSYHIPYCLLIGERELKLEKVTLKDMGSGNEEALSLEETISKLKTRSPLQRN